MNVEEQLFGPSTGPTPSVSDQLFGGPQAAAPSVENQLFGNTDDEEEEEELSDMGNLSDDDFDDDPEEEDEDGDNEGVHPDDSDEDEDDDLGDDAEEDVDVSSVSEQLFATAPAAPATENASPVTATEASVENQLFGSSVQQISGEEERVNNGVAVLTSLLSPAIPSSIVVNLTFNGNPTFNFSK